MKKMAKNPIRVLTLLLAATAGEALAAGDPPLRVPLERTDGKVFATVPRIGAWNGGYLTPESVLTKASASLIGDGARGLTIR